MIIFVNTAGSKVMLLAVRHEQGKDNKPGTEGRQDGKPQVPNNGQSIDLPHRVTRTPLAFSGHVVWNS